MSDDETTNNENVNTEETSGTITEEWVDNNVIGSNDSDDSVTDCCCDKRVTIDNGNWCVKIPRKEFTVKESIDFLEVIDDIFKDYLPHFGSNYDVFHALRKIIYEYKKNALTILYDEDCVEIKGDVSYHADKI